MDRAHNIAVSKSQPSSPRSSDTLRGVIAWCLPTYTAVVVALVVGLVNGALPFRVQIGFFGVWMMIALILPIATLVATVKAAAVPFRAPDAKVRLLRPVFGWCLVAVAVTMNVFCYAVVARALR